MMNNPFGVNTLIDVNNNLNSGYANQVYVMNENITSKPLGLDISNGCLSNMTSRRIFGFNPDIDNTYEDVWSFGGTYVFPPTGGTACRVVSSSVNDTGVGTGAQTVEIFYLDSNYDEYSVIITLNGTTPVSLTQSITRVNSFHVMSVGTLNAAAGNISLQNSAGTITYGYIQANENVATQAIYTIPRNKDGYIVAWGAGSGAATAGHYCRFNLRATTDYDHSYLPGLFQFQDIILTQDTSIMHEFVVFTKCPQFTDIKISSKSDTGTANVVAQSHFEVILVDR